jgi:hypothetical protein
MVRQAHHERYQLIQNFLKGKKAARYKKPPFIPIGMKTAQMRFFFFESVGYSITSTDTVRRRFFMLPLHSLCHNEVQA